jgi:hypothetical protein
MIPTVSLMADEVPSVINANCYISPLPLRETGNMPDRPIFWGQLAEHRVRAIPCQRLGQTLNANRKYSFGLDAKNIGNVSSSHPYKLEARF